MIKRITMSIVVCISLVLSIWAGYWETKDIAFKAVVQVPIADMIGDPVKVIPQALENNTVIALSYDEESEACPRIHQLLRNEVVEVVQENDQVKKHNGWIACRLPNVFHEIPGEPKGTRHNIYWTHESNLCFLNNLKKNGALHAVPQPYVENFNSKDISTKVLLENTLTLVQPWFESTTKTWYSAGTRFVLSARQPEAGYAVELIDFPSLKVRTHIIAKEYAIVKYDKSMLIDVLKAWTLQKRGTFPYVFGGCSCNVTYEPNNFTKEAFIKGDTPLYYWARTGNRPHTGFDCSGLLVRSTQVCGMPYFFKNTTALSKYLQPLGEHDTLQEGDLIFFPGHVMIVSSVKDNECIEAVGYGSQGKGYGSVHALKLNEVFVDIATFDDLVKAYHEKRKLKRFNRFGEIITSDAGEPREILITLLKLDSIYQESIYK